MALTFVVIFLWHLVGVFGDEVKVVHVKEGDSVTLTSDVTEKQGYDMLEWSLAAVIIAKFSMKSQPISFNNSVDERFRNRLQLDHQTGSLTIMNTRTTDSGLYKLQMTGTHLKSKSFNVTVFVVNVGHVTLSWYKGNSLLSSISVSDLISSVSLHLEVEYQDKNTYSCVINNPISRQTTHLDINEICPPCLDISSSNICYCGTAESVIRLVISAVVGVAAAAAVVVLIYDIRSRKAEQERKERKK